MEDPAFWRDLEARFHGPADRARDLHATLVPTALYRDAATAWQEAINAIQDPLSALDDVCLKVRCVASAVRMAREGPGPEGNWVISGGPNNDQGREVLRRQFEVDSSRAAKAADAVGTDATEEQAIQAWLHLLKRSKSPYFEDWGAWGSKGMLNELYWASAFMCHELDTRAQNTQFTQPQEKQHKTRLARNIDVLRKECGWTYEATATAIGMHKDSVTDHITKGTRPRPDTLESYARSFSEKLDRHVSVSELETGDI
jgi:hypothetical protein